MPTPHRAPQWHHLFSRTLLGLVLIGGAVVAMAAETGYVRGQIGARKFEFRQTLDMQQALKRALDPYNPMPAPFNGPPHEDGTASFSQMFWFRPDASALQLRIDLRAQRWAALAPGDVLLGDQPIENDEQGWNGRCPDEPGPNGYVRVTLYGPMKDEPNPMLLNTGPELAYYQSHRTRIHTDKLTLHLDRVDRKAGWVEGRIDGTLSQVKSIYSPQERLRQEVPCDAGKFKIDTIPLRIEFKLEVRRW